MEGEDMLGHEVAMEKAEKAARRWPSRGFVTGASRSAGWHKTYVWHSQDNRHRRLRRLEDWRGRAFVDGTAVLVVEED
jgi:hypothetical protein